MLTEIVLNGNAIRNKPSHYVDPITITINLSVKSSLELMNDVRELYEFFKEAYEEEKAECRKYIAV